MISPMFKSNFLHNVRCHHVTYAGIGLTLTAEDALAMQCRVAQLGVF